MRSKIAAFEFCTSQLNCDVQNLNAAIFERTYVRFLVQKCAYVANHPVWFLNLASAYRDMMAENFYEKFNIKNHNACSYYIMGCSGPFGINDKENPEKITF